MSVAEHTGSPAGGRDPAHDAEGRLPMWRLRVVLYVLILLAAASTLVVEPAIAGAVQRGAVSARWLFLPIGVFLAFMLAFAADRAWLVRRRRYPAGRAVFQIAFGVLFAFLLLPSTLSSYRSRPMAPNGRLLQHADPEVRAAAVYALGFDAPTRDSVERVVARLDDEAPIVRRAATAVLARWSGSDDGNTAGVRTWASEFFARGDRIEGRARGQVRTSSSGGD